MMMTRGLYIHIPFCSSICTYCDFYKMIAKNEKKDKYIEYLIKEIEIKKDLLKNIDTIYFGGGSPSSISLNLLESLFSKLSSYIDFKEIKEFSIECNPLEVTKDLISLFHNYNVNRISLGVQSFHDDKLSFLGRNHRKKDIFQAIKLIKEAGISNINIDLIYGTPFDNLESIKDELDLFYSLDLPHLSFYSLILEEHTILYKKYLNNEFSLIDESLENEIYSYIVSDLEKNGYERYEISNFSKAGFNSIHNLKYWNCEEYVSLGASASSFYSSKREKTISNLNKYFASLDADNIALEEDYHLSKEELMNEMMMLGLRKSEGVSISSFIQRFNVDPKKYFKDKLGRLESIGLIDVDREHIKIKDDKFFVSNIVMMEFV